MASALWYNPLNYVFSFGRPANERSIRILRLNREIAFTEATITGRSVDHCVQRRCHASTALELTESLSSCQVH